MTRTAPFNGPLPLPIVSEDKHALSDWPVTQGIPIPEGTLARGAHVRVLDPDGKAIPTQSQCLATWDPDRRFVKWLLIDFPVTRASDTSPVYQLDIASGQSAPLPEFPVVVKATRQAVTLSNGKLELELKRGTPDFFYRLETRLSPEDPPTSWLLEHRRPHLFARIRDRQARNTPAWECCSDQGTVAPLIDVTTEGPLHAIVTVRGYHFTPEGLRCLPYVLRLHLYADRADLRVEHTLIFDQSPDRYVIEHCGWRCPLKDEQAQGWVGHENGDQEARLGKARLGFVQTTQDQYRLFDTTGDLDQGERAPGWLCHGRVGAVLTETWRDYPVGLHMLQGIPGLPTAEARTLVFDFWPDDVDALDLSSPYAQTSLWVREPLPLPDEAMRTLLNENPGVPLDLHFAQLGKGDEALDRCDRLREQLSRLAPERPYVFSNTDIANAFGMAKTHTVRLLLSETALEPSAVRDMAHCEQHPTLAFPPPDVACASGALRLLHPHDPERFPAMEDALANLFEKTVVEPQALCRIFGKFDYGELINGHNVNDPLVYRAFLRNPQAWPDVLQHLGTFNNESQDVIRQLWSFYLRTGNPAVFRQAAAKSRHTIDVDFIHRLPRDGQTCVYPNHPSRMEGQMHYHSATHWSGPVVTSHSLISGVVSHYVLSGDPRAREVTLAMADNLVRNQTPNGLLREQGLHREITGGISILLEAWQLTWRETYRSLALNTLRMLYAVRNATGNVPQKIFTGTGPDETGVDIENAGNRTGYPGGMLWYVLYDAAQRFPEEPWIKDWCLQLAHSWIHGVPADDVLPEVRLKPVDQGGIPLYEIRPGWFWHSWISYANCFFDPLVAWAWHLSHETALLGYLVHRARVMPTMLNDAAKCFSGHSFNAINHAGESAASLLSVLDEAGEASCLKAWDHWKQQRKEDGFPVSDGPYTGFDSKGQPMGTCVQMQLRIGSRFDPDDDLEALPQERITVGTWDPRLKQLIP